MLCSVSRLMYPTHFAFLCTSSWNYWIFQHKYWSSTSFWALFWLHIIVSYPFQTYESLQYISLAPKTGILRVVFTLAATCIWWKVWKNRSLDFRDFWKFWGQLAKWSGEPVSQPAIMQVGRFDSCHHLAKWGFTTWALLLPLPPGLKWLWYI